MAWQRKRKERERGRERKGKFRVQRESKKMLIYLSSQIKQVHKGKTFSFSKSILEVIFKNTKNCSLRYYNAHWIKKTMTTKTSDSNGPRFFQNHA